MHEACKLIGLFIGYATGGTLFIRVGYYEAAADEVEGVMLVSLSMELFMDVSPFWEPLPPATFYFFDAQALPLAGAAGRGAPQVRRSLPCRKPLAAVD